MIDLDAFVLIGGRSSRLGTDKAFVELGGKTLAARAADTVEAALKPNRLKFVVGDGEQFNAGLIFTLGRPVVTDLKPGLGAWSGLDTALSYALSEWCLVLACDLPFASVELLRLLVSYAKDDVEAVVPRQSDGRLQPLCSLYKAKAARALLAEIFTGQKSVPPLSTIFEHLNTHIVEPSEFTAFPDAENLFLNVNNQTDLTAAEERSTVINK